MTEIPGSLQRKVNQLDNDVHEIYDMLSTIQKNIARLGARLTMFEGRVDDQFEVLGGRVGSLEGRFDGLERRFDGLERRFDGLETKVASLDGKIDRVESNLGAKIDALADLIRAS